MKTCPTCPNPKKCMAAGECIMKKAAKKKPSKAKAKKGY